ncbi:methyl-accepting chemotaxis protein [Sulfurivirga sp.]|uniref:methyl-accepting chemotaxis protein n=1 Tax=Sulfurivirga sp. TaxID=2614236 RepID=UPI0025EC5A64|nr:methyl-accepting chemotaxis protein [Sulfurivirga sp.]
MNSLKARILLLAIVPVIIVAVLSVWHSESLRQTLAAQNQAGLDIKVENLFKLSEQATLSSLYNQQFAFTRDERGLKPALISGDAKKVSKAVGHTFKRLKASELVADLQVFDRAGQPLVEKGPEGAHVSVSAVARKVLTEQKIVTDLTRDDRGMVYYALAFPVYVRQMPGKPAGVIVLSQSLAYMINKLAHSERNGYLLRDATGRIVFATGKDFDPQALAGIDLKQPQQVSLNGRTFQLTPVLLRNSAGKVLGSFVAVDDVSDNVRAIQQSWLWSVIELLVLIGLIVLVTVVSVNVIVRPIHAAEGALRRIAEGDLSQPFRVGRTVSEVAVLMELIEQLRRKVHDSMVAVIETSDRVSEASRTSLEASHRINEELSQENELVAQLDEMAKNMAQFADNVARQVQDAVEAANNANAKGLEGAEVLKGAVRSIDALAEEVGHAAEVISKLQEESEAITNILSVIQDIAEQTNLLALNAAIEAARAGEYGRGFAVVADEVRSLASRTQNSVQDIETIIQRLQAGTDRAVEVMERARERAAEGVQRSDEVNRRLGEIVELISVIVKENDEVARSAGQQTEEVKRVKAQAQKLYDIAQQAMKLSDSSAEKAALVEQLADEMRKLVHQFKI